MERVIVVSNISSFDNYIPRTIQKVGSLVQSNASPASLIRKGEAINIYYDPSMRSYWYENPDHAELKHILSVKPINANVTTEGLKFNIDEMPGHLYEFRSN
jgi:hypothetical protein